MAKDKNTVKYRDPETGRTKTGRIVVKPDREQDAENLREMARAAVQAGWELHQQTKKS